jgi:hypothetical protein
MRRLGYSVKLPALGALGAIGLLNFTAHPLRWARLLTLVLGIGPLIVIDWPRGDLH